jgi:hypothetical protein
MFTSANLSTSRDTGSLPLPFGRGVRQTRDPENGIRAVCDMGGCLYWDLAGFLYPHLLSTVGLGRVRPVSVSIFAFCGH